MTADDLVAGLRQAHEQMTPGPWRANDTPGDSACAVWSYVPSDVDGDDGERADKIVASSRCQYMKSYQAATESQDANMRHIAWLRNNALTIADEMERLAEQNERLKEAERYWNEARRVVPQPSTPRTWADDIVALHDLSGAKTKLEAENARLKRKADAFDLFMGCVDAVKDAEPSDVVNALLDKVKENARLRAEVERLRDAAESLLDVSSKPQTLAPREDEYALVVRFIEQTENLEQQEGGGS